MDKPILLLDVDGVLNPTLSALRRRKLGYVSVPLQVTHPVTGQDLVLPYEYLSNHRDDLSRLMDSFEIVWCTTWSEEANRVLAPLYGLPQLRVLPIRTFEPQTRGAGELAHKTMAIFKWLEAYEPGRPFVWVDDIIRRVDRNYLRSVVEYPHKGWLIDRNRGLQSQDVEGLLEWAETLNSDGADS